MSNNPSFFIPYKYLLYFYLLLNFVLRIVLINHPITTSTFTSGEVLSVFVLGFIRDILIFSIGYFIFWLYFIFFSNQKYNKPYGYIIFAILLGLWGWVTFGKTIISEYGGVLPEIAITFLSIKTVLFGICLFLPQHRTTVRKISYALTLFIFVLILVQNTVSEFFFWNEFGVRYNFIAVDYLVYTNEVIGNIMESYPVVPLFSIIALITLLTTYYIFKKTAYVIEHLAPLKNKVILSIVYLLVFGISLSAITKVMTPLNTDNIFAEELESNGVFKFYQAFNNSAIDYFKFYNTLPDDELTKNIKQFYPQYNGAPSLLRHINSDSTTIKKNVVLISIESLSADFMEFYGNTNRLTPFLDSLAMKSLFFTSTYATGNRTVRGLEAITMSIPPSPGESVVKRKDNKDKFTTGSVFAKNGYTVKYLYGGDAYFDNMQDFFEGNNYNIVDKCDFRPDQITFQNVWGVADGDMAKKAIEVMNEEYQQGKPFFNHIMTVSNHRPFTYPDGVLDTSDLTSARDKGVRYTDYAIKEFFALAKEQPWYDNTIFVILADHCASSAGKTQLPLDKYRIPAMIYAPKGLTPQQFDQMISQIDVMPTLLGILNFKYDSKFFGTNVLQADYKPRAFIATYQDLGYIRDNTLTILSPNQKVRQYGFNTQTVNNLVTPLTPIDDVQSKYVDEAISFYQFTAKQLESKSYNK
ncbi:sulfatase-like hydrolase/transferase [Myroides odoratimimus]|uniref:LTA synthase family protein n=1 Tax=Myroides odoratimimus TaxID=76832 RepID=UPI00257871C7|nr:alkaline phosphatase family protein [Myroides odoratimimus]MDM1085573.1 sulfatase-like hydrolase/transferase [Myroides odoratimimus]MDM1457646.1 sulfatase-like hydrolase/transferase [Myroides odoratimimus]MEC4086148.1 sulfatase-like hydrolase/transferase [Myroides odoratimimus]